MSGYLGIVRTGKQATPESVLRRIAESLRFRGPDGIQIVVKDGWESCFSLLETRTHHQAKAQPVGSGKRYQLLGEVRLDDRSGLIRELQGAGTATKPEMMDEELVLQAWSVWGDSAAERLFGDYSFAVWDDQEKTLTCLRDFAGVRPFFYACKSGAFTFSNTLRTLRLVPEISSDLDELFLRDFLLQAESVNPELTAWRDIRRLPPGHIAKYSGGEVHVQRIRQLPIEDPLSFKRPQEYIEAFHSLLRIAVKDRMTDGNVSLFLSGGLDSGAVCALFSEIADKERLKAFTISWRPLFDDTEPEFAIKSARFLGLSHEILEESPIVPFRGQSTRMLPEPTLEVFCDRAQRQYQAISKHARVALGGDGGDDLLTGQSWPYLQYLWSRGDWVEIISRFGGYLREHGQFPALRGGFRGRMKRWFGKGWEKPIKPGWLNAEFARRCATRVPEKAATSDANEVHPLHPLGYRALHSGYWGSVYELEDSGWTGAPLDVRAPLLDLRVIRFLLRVPPVPWCVNKEILRRAMVGHLPVEVLERPKSPLTEDPLMACQRNGWKPETAGAYSEQIREYVDWEKWLATLREHEGSLSWEDLCPLALSLWLNCIENEGSIE